MVHVIGQCHLSIARRPRPISVSQCTNAMAYTCRPWVLLPTIGRYCLANSRRQLKSSTRYANNLVDACRPWVMLHGVSRRRLPDAKIQLSCMQDLADTACHWRTSLAKYSHSISVCAGLGWIECHCPSSRAKNVHATPDAFNPWLMFSIFADICIQMFEGYALCWLEIFDIIGLMCVGYR